MIKDIVLNNVTVYDKALSIADAAAIATDTTPSASLATSGGTATLLWHDTFSEGGDVLSFGSGAANKLTYLRPKAPTTVEGDSTNIHFGGLGVIEIPFFGDFDEYFWTSANSAARTQWCFQFRLTLPAFLSPGTVFEFQDLVRLRVVLDTDYKFRASFSADSAQVTAPVALVAGQSYNICVARDAGLAYININGTDYSTTAPFPAVYAYDKTIGIVIGDCVAQEFSEPFGGKLERIALHNNENRTFQPKDTAVFYYDIDSLDGDLVIDQGNRALNSYAGKRINNRAPAYSEGGFEGGAYVAATGGLTATASSPSPGYIGQLSKALTKDAVVQRRGDIAFLSSNGYSYVIDDQAQTFRALGIPRPTTKVSARPQGVGAIDGFVRYAYRYITTDGTVGPAFEIDPIDATGGVNVFLGADGFSGSSDPIFGLSYGEAESGGSERFVIRDRNASNTRLLNKPLPDGITAETAFRIPSYRRGGSESVLSQGVTHETLPFACLNGDKQFPYWAQRSGDATIQFTFRPTTIPATSYTAYCLFSISNLDQHYRRGNSNKYRANHLTVMLQNLPASGGGVAAGTYLTVSTQTANREEVPRLVQCNITAGHDYSLFVSRTGTQQRDLVLHIYDHTADTWALWSNPTWSEIRLTNAFEADYYQSVNLNACLLWGANRLEGRLDGRVRHLTGYDPAQGLTFSREEIQPFQPGWIMYHGRAWSAAKSFQQISARALDRYGALTGPLARDLEIDTAFCSDSSDSSPDGGFDRHNDLRCKFYAPTADTTETDVTTILSNNIAQTLIFSYGADNAATSTDDIPIWAAYSTRNRGSLVVGVGQKTVFELAESKWHAGSKVRLFSEFANTIDVTEWTWLTFYITHSARATGSSIIDANLRLLYIDGNGGEWSEIYDADPDVGGIAANSGAGNEQYALVHLGGPSGITPVEDVEFAEFRMWDGERYVSSGVTTSGGSKVFGPYISSRIPPNEWDEMWFYARFAPDDVNDITSQSTMDQYGLFVDPTTSTTQKTSDSINILNGAEVKTGSASGSSGETIFVPFPTPPLSSIRGIQIFRTQVTPVAETFPNGEPNPNASIDAFRACRAAPLYYLSEIPTGTDFYYDFASDAFLGFQLDLGEGVLPRNIGGVCEWFGYLALWSRDRTRLYFADTKDSWESFPQSKIYDIPLRDTSGPITAAAEIGARDDRFSRLLVLGKSWGVFVGGTPDNPLSNSIGSGVGAWSSRCLAVQKAMAFAYNGTLWAISGDGAVEDIGLAVIDLLPPPEHTRLSVSAVLSSLFVINEQTGLVLRYHFARREWFVEDRDALSVTDINGVDYWVQTSGYLVHGSSSVYADDVNADTAQSYPIVSFSGANDFTVADATGISVGQRVTIAANQDPRVRVTARVQSVLGNTVTVDSINLPTSGIGPTASPGGSATIFYNYTAYVGVGYWGTMLDSGQFVNRGTVSHADLGIVSGTRWHGMSASADFAGDPADRSAFDNPESYPTLFDGGVGGVGGPSSRWGLGDAQRLNRLVIWTYEPAPVGLSELELNYTP